MSHIYGRKYLNVLSAVFVAYSGSHEVEELFEVNLTGTIGIEVGDHLVDGLVLGLESEGCHGSLQLLWVD
jgi:hypothetical protein